LAKKFYMHPAAASGIDAQRNKALAETMRERASRARP
jgi:hypothetical protein